MGRCHYCLSASVADCCISVNGRDVESLALLLIVTLVNFSVLPLMGVLFDTVMTLLTPEMIVALETTTLLHQARWTFLGFGVVVAIAVAVLNGWMIWRFRAPEIRAQFH